MQSVGLLASMIARWLTAHGVEVDEDLGQDDAGVEYDEDAEGDL